MLDVDSCDELGCDELVGFFQPKNGEFDLKTHQLDTPLNFTLTVNTFLGSIKYKYWCKVVDIEWIVLIIYVKGLVPNLTPLHA